MSEHGARRFVDALSKLESEHDLEEIVTCFAEECEGGNVGRGHFYGRDGARHFWKKYRETFTDIKSVFHNIIVSDDHAAIEWTSDGSSANGDPIHYSGVCILEMDGDYIKRFQAYFNADDLRRQMGLPVKGAKE